MHHGDSGAHWSGVERCSSIWACPVCSSVIRAERSADVQEAVTNWQEAGGSLVFVTLTLRHALDDPLDMTLDAAMSSWRRLLQGRAGQSFKKRFGIKGCIRAVEVTLSGENGWHPHIHGLFFVDKPLNDGDLAEWKTQMFDRWATYVTEAGARLPTKLRGIDVRPADADGKVVAQYLSKLQDTHGMKPTTEKRNRIGQELTRFDTKGGRRGSLTPFELLDVASAQDEWDDQARARLWWEYYTATKGRQAITWSKGLRELCGLPPKEKTDEQILDESAVQERLVMLIPAKTYRRRIQNEPGVMGLVLDHLERGNWLTAEVISGGHLVYDTRTGELGVRPKDEAS